MARAPKDSAGPTPLKIGKMRPGDMWGSNRPSVWDKTKGSDLPFDNVLDIDKPRGPGDALHHREEEAPSPSQLFARGGKAVSLKSYKKKGC